jgi:hypothetical protein
MEIDNMGLEERRREQSEENSLRTDQHRRRYRGLLEQEMDYSTRHHDAHNDAGAQVYESWLEVWSDREQEIRSAGVEMAILTK